MFALSEKNNKFLFCLIKKQGSAAVVLIFNNLQPPVSQQTANALYLDNNVSVAAYAAGIHLLIAFISINKIECSWLL